MATDTLGRVAKSAIPKSAVLEAVLLQSLADATGGAAVFLAHLIKQITPMVQDALADRKSVIVISRPAIADGGKFNAAHIKLKD